MNLIYLVVSIILGTISWVTTQFSWQYAYILEYIFLFLTGWYICLFLFHQDEFDRSKTYNLLTPIHLIYTVIMIVLIVVWLGKYRLKDYSTIKYAFYKMVLIINAVQAILLNLYYKLKQIYTHL